VVAASRYLSSGLTVPVMSSSFESEEPILGCRKLLKVIRGTSPMFAGTQTDEAGPPGENVGRSPSAHGPGRGPRRTALHCHRNAFAIHWHLGHVPFSPHGLKSNRTRGGKSGGVAGQPQHPRLWRTTGRTPNARSTSHSPSSPPPTFTQSPFLPRSLV